MEGSAVAVCEILKYLIIHWKCEIAKEALLEGQLVISIEALNSKHQTNTLHCVTTITSAGSIYGGLAYKTFLKEMRSILPGFSAKLDWTSEEASYSQDVSRATPFQMTFETDENPRTLVTDSLVIKNFLRKIVMVHPKIRFNFSVKMNGVLSTEIFGSENEPTLNLSNGVALALNCRHYMRVQEGDNEFPFQSEHTQILTRKYSSVCVLQFTVLYMCFPQLEGLPLILPSQEQSITTVFKDISYFIDWKKYRLCMVPNLDLDLDRDMVLPDTSYQVEPSEGHQSQHTDPRGQTLLLILFVDFHSGFPVQQVQLWGAHTALRAHLSAILRASHSAVRESIQLAMDRALEQHHQAAKARQRRQTSLTVAVSSIMSIVTGSTSHGFRKICLQALQAADTQELGTKLHRSFHEITQHRALHHCSGVAKQQLLPEKNGTEDRTEGVREDSSGELLVGASGQAENKRLKKGRHRQVVEGTRAFHSARGRSPSEAALRSAEPPAASLTPGGNRAGPGGDPEDALWLQEVSNLSEWLSPGT